MGSRLFRAPSGFMRALSSPFTSRPVAIILIAVLYGLLAKIGFVFTSRPDYITPVFPAAGLALAAVLLLGRQALLGIWLGSFGANTFVAFSNQSMLSIGAILSHLGVASCIGLGAMLSAGVGAQLVQWRSPHAVPLYSGWQVLRFIGLGALVGGVLSPTVGVLTLAWRGYVPWHNAGEAWLIWWLGNVTGVILLAPLLLVWRYQPHLRWRPLCVVEAAALGGALVMVSAMVFGRAASLFEYVLPLLLLWAASRFGMRGVVTGTAVIALFAVIGTSQGTSPFVQATLHESLLYVQVFLSVTTTTALTLAGVLTERQHLEQRGRDLEVNRHKIATALRESEEKYRKPDGTVMDCSMNATVRRAPDGSMLGYQGIRRDITEQQRIQQLIEDHSRILEHRVEERTRELQTKNAQLEDTLRQLQTVQTQLLMQQKLASLGALTAGIAHEIRNPLNFVTNFADLSVELVQELRELLARHQPLLAADTCADLEDILYTLEQNVQKIIEHGKRADRIVSGMLQHARSQAGRHEPIDLNALLAEYVTLAYHGMRVQDTAFPLSLETHYDPSIGLVEVVPQDLSRVLLNVLNNACYAVQTKHKALGGGFRPTLCVRTANLGERVEIRIRDNGDGIIPEVREQIFQPFFTTKPAGTGTGLGLSISHDIVVQEHKGTISIDTEVGKYAEFIITLPKQAT